METDKNYKYGQKQEEIKRLQQADPLAYYDAVYFIPDFSSDTVSCAVCDILQCLLDLSEDHGGHYQHHILAGAYYR
jgi:hypothetical protein